MSVHWHTLNAGGSNNHKHGFVSVPTVTTDFLGIAKDWVVETIRESIWALACFTRMPDLCIVPQTSVSATPYCDHLPEMQPKKWRFAGSGRTRCYCYSYQIQYFFLLYNISRYKIVTMTHICISIVVATILTAIDDPHPQLSETCQACLAL